MKKTIKLVVICIIVIILLWIIIFGINIIRCLNCKSPVPLFCNYILMDESGKDYNYIGGYRINVGKSDDEIVTWTEVYFGKKLLFKTRTDKN